MAKHVTRKSTAAGKAATIERRRKRRDRFTIRPLDTDALALELCRPEPAEAILARLERRLGF